jgi:hypothetical protein
MSTRGLSNWITYQDVCILAQWALRMGLDDAFDRGSRVEFLGSSHVGQKEQHFNHSQVACT